MKTVEKDQNTLNFKYWKFNGCKLRLYQLDSLEPTNRPVGLGKFGVKHVLCLAYFYIEIIMAMTTINELQLFHVPDICTSATHLLGLWQRLWQWCGLLNLTIPWPCGTQLGFLFWSNTNMCKLINKPQRFFDVLKFSFFCERFVTVIHCIKTFLGEIPK